MVTAHDFHSAWCKAAEEKDIEIKLTWSNPTDYSSLIMYENQSMIALVSENLGLKHYSEYYCIDKVLYRSDQDLVPKSPIGTTWLRRIRVAFEHENYFNSGLFQEISHLLITQCELRVLVSYPDSEYQVQPELSYLHDVISGTDTAQEISDKGSLLFIIGWRYNADDHDEVFWLGCLYNTTGWTPLSMVNSTTDIHTAYQKTSLPFLNFG